MSGGLLRTLLQTPYDPSHLAILTVAEGGTAALWDGRSGVLLNTMSGHDLPDLGGHERWVENVSFSPDGRRLATTSRFDPYRGARGETRLWNTADLAVVRRLEKHQGSVEFIGFSPDSRYLVTTSLDQTACLWNAEDGTLHAELKGHAAAVVAAAFSADGAHLATASEDRTARLWAVADGRLLAVFRGHRAAVRRVLFGPTGRWLLTGSDDGNARLWQLPPRGQALIEWARELLAY